MTEERLIGLVVRQLGEEIDAAELQELEGWAGENQANRALLNRVTNVLVSDNGMVGYTRFDPANGYLRWANKRATLRVIRMRSFTAAAVLLLAVATGIFLYIRNKHSTQEAIITPNLQQEKPILPGRNTAVLTLADDRQILL